MIKKTFFKTLGISVINIRLSPLSLSHFNNFPVTISTYSISIGERVLHDREGNSGGNVEYYSDLPYHSDSICNVNKDHNIHESKDCQF